MGIIGRFGGGYAIVQFRGAYVEVGLADMRSANRILEVLGRDGELRLHLPSTKSTIHYLVDAQALISLSEMSNGISNRNQTTWTNTDTMTSPGAFYAPTHNQHIASHEMGGFGGV